MFEYNREAAKFESKINKGKLRGTKPIRIPRISLDAPSKTIARYNSFNKKYQNIFDNNFKTKKYSFVIPKDLRTIPELRDDILNPKSTTYKNMINTLKKGFNEFDEQKLFEKIKSRTPKQLQNILKKIPRIASVDDFTGPGGFPLTAGLDSNIGIKPVDEKKFLSKKPCYYRNRSCRSLIRNTFRKKSSKSSCPKTFRTSRSCVRRLFYEKIL